MIARKVTDQLLKLTFRALPFSAPTEPVCEDRRRRVGSQPCRRGGAGRGGAGQGKVVIIVVLVIVVIVVTVVIIVVIIVIVVRIVAMVVILIATRIVLPGQAASKSGQARPGPRRAKGALFARLMRSACRRTSTAARRSAAQPEAGATQPKSVIAQ